MELQQLIEKWEQEMADRLKWIENEKDLAKRYIHISAHTAISDMLADVKQLNLPPVSNRREQLIAFARWLAHEEEYGKDGAIGTVDAYLESN